MCNYVPRDMIRRLFATFVFCATVGIAAYGQNIFGRDDIIVLAHQLKAEGPQRAAHAWHETDKMLASLAPSAGSETALCTFEDLAWAKKLYE